MVVGIILGPIAAKFIDSERWGSAQAGQTQTISLVKAALLSEERKSKKKIFVVANNNPQGIMRVMIGVQLVIAGFQLPAKYQLTRWKEMAMCLLPIMTMMWLCTTLCMMATVPKLTFLAALVIGSCVTCTDPILSQAIAKGPFADKYVARDLREIISSEAGANDGFGFPFLMLATYLIKHAEGHAASAAGDAASEGHGVAADIASHLASRATDLLGRSEHELARLGGGVGAAMKDWFVETWVYVVILSVVYGVTVGWLARKAITYALSK